MTADMRERLQGGWFVAVICWKGLAVAALLGATLGFAYGVGRGAGLVWAFVGALTLVLIVYFACAWVIAYMGRQ